MPQMDKDRSGEVDVEEFRAALGRMGIAGVSPEVAAAVLRRADANGDGHLDFKEILAQLKARAPWAAREGRRRARQCVVCHSARRARGGGGGGGGGGG